MSRIDYYYGMDKTIQRGDLGNQGEMFKIVPMHSDISPSDNDYISCWYKPLPKWLHSKGQTVVPTNLAQFTLTEIEAHRGQLCYKFERRNTQFNKTNTYILYATVHAPHRPLRYEMIGYDDMMTSHYDHYIIDYTTFEPWKLNTTIFNVPGKPICNKKQPIKSTYMMNPMAEFMHFSHAKDMELEKSYHNYKTKHKKAYNSTVEHERRKHIYKHNLRLMN
ncbi:hypothetical protein QZH41_012399 [Actinostola sp. cb2023]|nr:hypothetical protein QZH41_012399 [Actinostola sp. cb2023]